MDFSLKSYYFKTMPLTTAQKYLVYIFQNHLLSEGGLEIGDKATTDGSYMYQC